MTQKIYKRQGDLINAYGFFNAFTYIWSSGLLFLGIMICLNMQINAHMVSKVPCVHLPQWSKDIKEYISRFPTLN